MKKYWILFSTGLLLSACSADYDIGQSNVLEQNRLVINSLLNPTQSVSVYFYKTERTDAGYGFSAIRDVKVVLKEEEKILFDGVCGDTVLRLDYYPKAGLHYAIEVSCSGYESVSANTLIPDSITCKAEMFFGEKYESRNWLVHLSGFKLPVENQASLYITAYSLSGEGSIKQYNDLYTNNLLVDPVNQISGMPVLNPTVGSLYHDAFLRIKNNNLPDLDKLVFTPRNASDSKQKQTGIKLIAAGREYDQYCRTLYLQKSMIIYDNDISAIVYQPVQVYSNVKNGMGLFAGMNETNYYFDLPNEETFPYSPAALGAVGIDRPAAHRK